jgi:subtilase family serine protease
VSVPAAVAGAITTIQLSPEAVPLDPHQPLDAAASAVTASTLAGSAKTAASSTAQCSVYYGQKQATGLPKAYGRTLTWAPCGYSPAQLRTAYGATRAGLTGAGVTVAVVSLATDPTALSDANHWSRQEDVPQFAAGQFKTYIAPDGAIGGDPENALDIEAVHGTAPAAKVDYVVGNGQITGDYLLDGLDTVVTHRLADVVTSSWYESHMPVPASMIKSWESVLERAAAEGITVDEASGDTTDLEGLEYPGSDPWITSVGGTSLAIGVGDRPGRQWQVLEPGRARIPRRRQHRRRLHQLRRAQLPARRGQREHREGQGDARRAGRVRDRRPGPRLPDRRDGVVPPRERQLHDQVRGGGQRRHQPLGSGIRRPGG